MVATETAWKAKKNVKTEVAKKNPKKGFVSEVVIEKKVSNNPDADVSVFTKTTSPKVVVQSEKMDTPQIIQNIHRHRVLKSICLIVMGIIILMTFFLSLKTYNTVNELYQSFNSAIN